MKLEFFKYQGAGNDFVMIDNRDKKINLSQSQVVFLCDRRFGIGADGLILIEPKQGFDFEMIYYNSDGNTSSMCGNGGRCITAFAKQIGLIDDEAYFWAADGKHNAEIKGSLVALKMNDVSTIETVGNDYFLDTGSPHYVIFKSEIENSIIEKAKEIRYNARFKEKGTNVNFVKIEDGFLKGRTYERGVEDETLSCGTGVTAMAIAAHYNKNIKQNKIDISTPGGNLTVSFLFDEVQKKYYDIYLTGPAQLVFEGVIEV
ncbi:MAG: diaminopimelate epimerase [Bacteroidota bacterium]